MFAVKGTEDRFDLSHMDTSSLLSSWSKHSINLDDCDWPSVEHYVQAMKYDNPVIKEKICTAEHPRAAKKFAEAWWRKKKANWKTEREVFMKRGMYTKCKTYPEVAKALLETGEKAILDTSNFDYYWGCGRDIRGENRFGKILMDIRTKLLEEDKASSA